MIGIYLQMVLRAGGGAIYVRLDQIAAIMPVTGGTDIFTSGGVAQVTATLADLTPAIAKGTSTPPRVIVIVV